MSTAAADHEFRIKAPVNRNLLTLAMGAIMVLALLGPLMIYSEAGLVSEGNTGRQIIYAVLFVGVLVALRPLEWERLIAVPLPMVAALGWCWISLAWSIDPLIALRRLLLTTMIIWMIYVGVRQLGTKLTIDMMRISFCVILVGNYAAVLLFPEFGIHLTNIIGDKDLAGSWRGIMSHKNFAGQVSALLIPLLIFDGSRRLLWLRIAGVVAAAVFLYFSHSKTSLGLIGVAVLCGYAFHRLDPRRRAYILPLAMVLFAIMALLNDIYRNPILSLLRDPEAVTGRSSIWRPMLAYVNDHTLLGAGFGSFWNIGPGAPIFQYAKGWITTMANGHNGFLDLTVQLGVPGMLLVVFAAIILPLTQLIRDSRIKSERAAIVVSIIVFAFMHNATETSLFDRDVILQVFLTFAIAAVPAFKDEADRAERRVKTPWATSRMRNALS